MKYILHVNSTYNNTLLNLTDAKGNTIIWESSGKNKFKGSKKSTSFASQISAEKIAKYLKFKKISILDIRIKGAGLGRDSVLRTINNFGIKINSISDVTPLPHNGCRPPKKRRT